MTIENYKKQLTACGSFEFFGLKMTQIPEALIKISTLLQITKPKKIIEFGTGYGGLSVLLNIYAIQNNSKFITYDAVLHREDLLKLTKIDFRLSNLENKNVQEEIINEISNEKGRVILFCDALKSEEAKIYAPIIKSGDILLIHDYSRFDGGEEFKETVQQHSWTAPQEQWLEKFQNILSKDDIIPLFHDEFENVLWFCGIKK